MSEIRRRYTLASEQETAALGGRLARLARPGVLFALSGPLGAGKTSLARGLINALASTEAEEIVSPTFTLAQTYDTERGPVWHFDLYRLKNASDVIELGFEDAVGDICVVEWPDRLGHLLPADRVDVRLGHAGVGRVADVIGHGSFADAVRTWGANTES